MGSCPEGMTPAPGGGCVNMNPGHHNQMKRGGNVRKFSSGGSSVAMRQAVHQASMQGQLNVNDVVHTNSHILCQNFDCSPFTTAGSCNAQQCCSFVQGTYSPNMGGNYGGGSGTWEPGHCENSIAMRKGGRLNKRKRKMARGGRFTKPRPARRSRRGRKFHAGGTPGIANVVHSRIGGNYPPDVRDTVHMNNHIMNGPYGGAPAGGRPGAGRRGSRRTAATRRPNVRRRQPQMMKRGGRTKPIKKYPHGGQHCGPGMTMGAHGGCIPHSNGYRKGGRTKPMRKRGRRRR